VVKVVVAGVCADNVGHGLDANEWCTVLIGDQCNPSGLHLLNVIAKSNELPEEHTLTRTATRTDSIHQIDIIVSFTKSEAGQKRERQ